MATVMIEPKKPPRMKSSLFLSLNLLQRIVFDTDEVGRDVAYCRIGALALGEVGFLRALPVHQSGKPIISFVAARFVIDSVRLLALLRVLLLHRPGLHPHRRIFDS